MGCAEGGLCLVAAPRGGERNSGYVEKYGQDMEQLQISSKADTRKYGKKNYVLLNDI